MSLKLYIHIGTEKTGTTSIQSSLNLNRDTLQGSGIYIPKTFGVTNQRLATLLSMNASRNDDFTIGNMIESERHRKKLESSLKQKFIQEVESVPPNTDVIIISTEQFHSRILYREEVQRLRVFLESLFEEIYIVSYFRDPIHLVEPAYSTLLSSGNYIDAYGKPSDDTPLFSDFVKHWAVPTNHYLNASAIKKLWGDEFGEKFCIFNDFERNKLLERDVVVDFYSLVGFFECDKLKVTPNLNESINSNGMLLLYKANSLFPRFGAFSCIRNDIAKKVICDMKGKHKFMSSMQKLTIEARFSSGEHPSSLQNDDFSNQCISKDNKIVFDFIKENFGMLSYVGWAVRICWKVVRIVRNYFISYLDKLGNRR
ncbi:hypothetical protein VCHA34P129_100032 [Vibrio chagasii]|nr:hypothetical protein VCHA34P129_100032 [Vibrio chagasii]CAH6907589.1 hypothetical protein VCHA52P455_100047 [Vibrio chagasii]